ncbi:MAG TPA: SRPBCC domain-containing protein [Candidatus Dormibacteraeota bacterium]|nr:SRPBCC domain-containing protein [Candidatus Dormibacteraeota bacterium]
MIEPLRISFTVECSAEHAFDTWTARATAWWPAQHSVSHEEGAQIVFEPRPGGRIFERTSSGEEIEWGVIIEWSRPRRLRYTWHIATDPKNATDVEIVFRPESRAITRVEIEHGGWDRLGEIGPAWREANHAGWDGVSPAYTEACAARD